MREINAITFHVIDMERSVAFYELLGFECDLGGRTAPFTSLQIGAATSGGPLNYVNLQLVDKAPATNWGRVIFHIEDVDAVHDLLVAAGERPEMAPSDAPWGERYFHVRDPDGHELSFAKRL